MTEINYKKIRFSKDEKFYWFNVESFIRDLDELLAEEKKSVDFVDDKGQSHRSLNIENTFDIENEYVFTLSKDDINDIVNDGPKTHKKNILSNDECGNLLQEQNILNLNKIDFSKDSREKEEIIKKRNEILELSQLEKPSTYQKKKYKNLFNELLDKEAVPLVNKVLLNSALKKAKFSHDLNEDLSVIDWFYIIKDEIATIDDNILVKLIKSDLMFFSCTPVVMYMKFKLENLNNPAFGNKILKVFQGFSHKGGREKKISEELEYWTYAYVTYNTIITDVQNESGAQDEAAEVLSKIIDMKVSKSSVEKFHRKIKKQFNVIPEKKIIKIIKKNSISK